MIKLHGSCHCRAVRFSVEADAPHPFMRCYCSICRKTAGGGGYAINLGAQRNTLQVEGEENLAVYRARMPDGSTSTGERNFCIRCGSALWLFDPAWPDLMHPHASAMDTPLPVPPNRLHMMLNSKAEWVEPEIRPGDALHEDYPDVSLAEWHQENAPKAP